MIGPCPHCAIMITSPGPEVERVHQVESAAVVEPPPLPAAVVESSIGLAAPEVSCGVVLASGQGVDHVAVAEAVVVYQGLSDARVVPVTLELPLPGISGRAARNRARRSAGEMQEAKPSRSAKRKAWVGFLLVLLVVMLGGGPLALRLLEWGGHQPTGVEAPALSAEPQARLEEKHDHRSGSQEDAREVLSRFLAADSVAGKAAFSLRGGELIGAMEEFYGPGRIDDSDTPLSGFFAEPLPPGDHARGIFMMRYERPPQFELADFFRPLAPLEVQYGLQEPDPLLASLAQAGNFTSEPVKVLACYKRGPGGLKFDWETFVQTKHRTFRAFTELPDPGRSGIFRVFVEEDVPEQGHLEPGMKTYRIFDPAHKADAVRVNVRADSDPGWELSFLDWRGVTDGRPTARTATLELEWTRDEVPRLVLKRFLCWEFLGIGGESRVNPGGK